MYRCVSTWATLFDKHHYIIGLLCLILLDMDITKECTLHLFGYAQPTENVMFIHRWQRPVVQRTGPSISHTEIGP